MAEDEKSLASCEFENSKEESSSSDCLNVDLEELDDKEFDLPTVDERFTLEGILNELEDDNSIDPEAVIHQFLENSDALSVGSQLSSVSDRSKQRRSPNQPIRGSCIRHAVLRNLSALVRQLSETIDVGTPTTLAVSNLIAIGTFHGVVLIFNNEQELKWKLTLPTGSDNGSVSCLSFNCDCTRILVGHSKGQITMWDVTTGKLLRSITDVHPPQTLVLHVKFTDDPTVAVCSDSGGSVFELCFKKILTARTCESNCIFSGSRGEVLIIEPLHVGDIPNHPSKELSLLALGTVTKAIVVQLRPTLKVCFTHDLRSDPDTLPLLAWQFCYIDSHKSKRSLDPVLAFGRKDTIFFYRTLFAKTTLKPYFECLFQVDVRHTMQNFCWLNSRSIAYVDVLEQLHVVDVRNNEELEVCDLSDVGLIYGNTDFKGLATGGQVSQAMALAGEHACFYSVVNCGPQILVLGIKQGVHVFTLRSWMDRIDFLVKQNLFPEALALVQKFIHDTSGVSERLALSGRLAKTQQLVEKMEWLTLSFVDYATTECPESMEGALSHYQHSIPLCVRSAIALDSRKYSLLDAIYERVANHPLATQAFLDALLPPIIDALVPQLNPQIVRDLMNVLVVQGKFADLESVISHLDVSVLDIHQVMTVCQEHYLFDAIIHVYNHGLHDYITPLVEMTNVIAPGSGEPGETYTDRQIESGNKLLVYVSCCLVGCQYPCGNRIEPPEESERVRAETYLCLTTRYAKGGVAEAHSFKHLRALVAFNAREFFNVLAMAFDDAVFHSVTGLSQKQHLVDILLEIMVQSGEGSYKPFQIGALFTFLARQMARKHDQAIRVNPVLFEQVVEYLTNPDDQTRSEERQQALMEVLQTGGLASIGENHILGLCEAVKFYHVCEYFYEKRGAYDKMLLCYLDETERRPQVFQFAANVLRVQRDSYREALERQIVESFEDLLATDNNLSSILILQHMPSYLGTIVEKLSSKPDTLYHFLQGIWHNSESQQQTLPPEIQEKYIELMCIFEPDKVLEFVRSNDGYRLEQTLEICRSHDATDATAFLLEKSGAFQEAFEIYVANIRLCIEAFSGGAATKTDLDEELSKVITFLRRNANHFNVEERETLWFELFDTFSAAQRTHPFETYLKTCTTQLLNSMIGHVAPPSIIQRIIQDPTYKGGEFGEIRAFIAGMLDTYTFEQNMLQTINRLLKVDLYDKLRQLKKVANRGYSSKTATCALCMHSFAQADAGSHVVTFRCGHAYHHECLASAKSYTLTSPTKGESEGTPVWHCIRCYKPNKKDTNMSSIELAAKRKTKVQVAPPKLLPAQPVRRNLVIQQELKALDDEVALSAQQLEALQTLRRLQYNTVGRHNSLSSDGTSKGLELNIVPVFPRVIEGDF